MTTTSKQIELLQGTYTLGLFTENYPFFTSFAKRFKEELQITFFISEGKATLLEDGEILINTMWSYLLKDHLGLADENFEDMNELVIAVHERGTVRDSFAF